MTVLPEPILACLSAAARRIVRRPRLREGVVHHAIVFFTTNAGQKEQASLDHGLNAQETVRAGTAISDPGSRATDPSDAMFVERATEGVTLIFEPADQVRPFEHRTFEALDVEVFDVGPRMIDVAAVRQAPLEPSAMRSRSHVDRTSDVRVVRATSVEHFDVRLRVRIHRKPAWVPLHDQQLGPVQRGLPHLHVGKLDGILRDCDQQRPLTHDDCRICLLMLDPEHPQSLTVFAKAKPFPHHLLALAAPPLAIRSPGRDTDG